MENASPRLDDRSPTAIKVQGPVRVGSVCVGGRPVEPAVEPAAVEQPAMQRLQSACPRLDSPSCSRRRRRRARRRVDLAAAVSRLAEIVPRLTEIVAPLEPLLARAHLAGSALPAMGEIGRR